MSYFLKIGIFVCLAILVGSCSPDKKSESLPVVGSNFDEMNILGIKTLRPEKLEYEIKYGLATGGKAIYETEPNLVEYNSVKCWETTITAETAGSVSWFTHIADTFYNYVDSAKTKTIATERHIREQRYTLHEQTRFHGDSAFTFNPRRKVVIKSKLPGGDVLGPVGSLQAMRFLPFESMQKYDTANVSFFMQRRIYQLRVVYLGTEKIKTRYGKEMAFLVTPVLPSNVMMSESDRAYIWISADERRIPLYSKAETRFGSVRVLLNRFKLY